MITREAYNQIVKQAKQSLLQYHLHDALHLMGSLLPELNDSNLIRSHESIERDYTAMLNFLADGGKDPSQTQMQCRMVQKAYILLNSIEIQYRRRQLDDILHLCYEKEELLKDTQPIEWYFYNGVCHRPDAMPTQEEIDIWFATTEEKERKMQLSGMMFGLFLHYDPYKVSFLCKCAQKEARALLGVVLTTILHEAEMPLFPETEEEIKRCLLAEQNQEGIEKINHDLFLACQMESIEEKIKNELMPVLFKGVQDEQLRMGFTLDEDDDDAFEKMLKKQKQQQDPGLSRKKKEFQNSAMELINMQREGVDVGTDFFVNAMSHPFFQDISHWFMPFDTEHEGVRDALYINGKPNSIIRLIVTKGDMCEIDQYAMAILMSKNMPSFAADLIQSFNNEIASSEALKNYAIEAKQLNGKEEIASCIKALYRLFIKSRWKHQLPVLFQESLNLLNNKYLEPAVTSNASNLLQIAKVMSKYNQPTNALEYLNKLSLQEGASSETLQLIAECQQKTGKYRQAINTLIQADVLNPDNTWILSQMMNCYVQLGNHEEQLECLLRLEALMPDSAKITTETGLCLMKLGRYQEASQRFYKLEIEEKQIIPSMRAIAWCSFKQKKYETALKYYKKIFNTAGASVGNVFADNAKKASTNLWADYLNAGHTAWMLDDMLSAQSFYHKYTELYLADDPKRTNALAPFDKDKDELMLHGKSQYEINLMHDIILYRC